MAFAGPDLVLRPLLGEPLGLDLLNTTWVDRGQPFDLLADLAGLDQWLSQAGLTGPEFRVNTHALRALHTARTAIRRHFEEPTSTACCAALNDVLAWGHTQPTVKPDGPRTTTHVDNPEQHAAWLAAINYIELRDQDPGRIRRCAYPECALYFFDTSSKASRRWCSMALCGNRAKAARHYARSRDGGRRRAGR